MLLPVRRADRLSARLGPAIRRSRRQAGLSQCELADLLSVDQSSVGKWERDTTDPAVGLFLQMVRLFGPSLLAMVFQAAGYGDGASGEREGDCRQGAHRCADRRTLWRARQDRGALAQNLSDSPADPTVVAALTIPSRRLGSSRLRRPSPREHPPSVVMARWTPWPVR